MRRWARCLVQSVPDTGNSRCQLSNESSEVWVRVSQASPVGDDVREVMGCQVMGGLVGHGKSIGFCFAWDGGVLSRALQSELGFNRITLAALLTTNWRRTKVKVERPVKRPAGEGWRWPGRWWEVVGFQMNFESRADGFAGSSDVGQDREGPWKGALSSQG